MKILKITVLGLAVGCTPVQAPWSESLGHAVGYIAGLLSPKSSAVAMVETPLDDKTVRDYVFWLQDRVGVRLPHIMDEVASRSYDILHVQRRAPRAQEYFDAIAQLIVDQYPNNPSHVIGLVRDCVTYYQDAQKENGEEEWCVVGSMDVTSARKMLGTLARVFWSKVAEQGYVKMVRENDLPLIPFDLLEYFPAEHRRVHPITFVPQQARMHVQIEVASVKLVSGERRMSDGGVCLPQRSTEQVCVTLKVMDRMMELNTKICEGTPADTINFLTELSSLFFVLSFEEGQPIDLHISCASGISLPTDFMVKFVEFEKKWPIKQLCFENMVVSLTAFRQLGRLNTIQHLVFNNASCVYPSPPTETPHALQALKALTFCGEVNVLPSTFSYFPALEVVELFLAENSQQEGFYDVCASAPKLTLLCCELNDCVKSWLAQSKICLSGQVELVRSRRDSLVKSYDRRDYCVIRGGEDDDPVRLAKYVYVNGTYYRL